MGLRQRLGSERPLPPHPYRGSAIIYAALALVLVGVAKLTGGDLLDAVGVAIAFFVVATGWSWWHFRRRLRAEAATGRRGGRS